MDTTTTAQAGNSPVDDGAKGVSLAQIRRILGASARYTEYEVKRKLGQGGMASVFLVHHPHLNELRALKVLQPNGAGFTAEDSHDARQLFFQEARLSRGSRHPHLVEVYDLSLLPGGEAILEMEFIDGESLSSRIQKIQRHRPQGLALNEALEIIGQLLAALGYLHGKGIVHRDVAPDNVMLQKTEEGTLQVKLIDLGIASPVGQRFVTGDGFLGKKRYSAPELFNGQLDQRADLYSLGIVFFEMVTGRKLSMPGRIRPESAFDGADEERRVPPEVRRLVTEMLARDPDDRPSCAENLRQRLEMLRQPPLARPPASLAEANVLDLDEGLRGVQDQLNLEFPEDTTHANARPPREDSRPTAPGGLGQALGSRRQRRLNELAEGRKSRKERRLRQFGSKVSQALVRRKYSAAERLIEGARLLVQERTLPALPITEEVWRSERMPNRPDSNT